MTKAPRKSIAANFAAALGPLETKSAVQSPTPTPQTPTPTPAPAAPSRVGAGVIGATRRTLTDMREERDALRAQIEDAQAVVELSPDLIDPSPYPDRMSDDSGADEVLARQIAEEGQQVPIQVRRSPTTPGRFQVVYGHRRWRAARSLQRPVKAIITELDDTQLLIAQGLENSARQDLTWIEKALFALRMEQQAIKARDIRAALAVDDGELARFRAVTRVVSPYWLQQIGRAPKVGRPRWGKFVGAYTNHLDPQHIVSKTLAAAKLRTANSDERFRAVLQALQHKPKPAKRVAELKLPDGKLVGRVAFNPTGMKIDVAKDEAANFADFLEQELPDLMARYAQQKG